MADTKPRTFVKTGPGGKTLTREVTGPQSEVQALFDGYHEQKAKSSSTSSASTAGGGKSGGSSH